MMPRKLVSSKKLLLLYIGWGASLPPLALYLLGFINFVTALPFAILSMASSILISYEHVREERVGGGKAEP